MQKDASNEATLTDGPLTGLRVIDFTSVVVGPVATQFLADYGADVIKVEAPTGDLLRRMGGHSQSGQLSPKFIQMNRNKRSICVDLRLKEGRKILNALLESADVAVVNMREPALYKLGLRFEDMSRVNSRIIHCSLTGFGKRGRHFGKPAYDTIIQGGAGVAACNHQMNGEPQFVPMVFADHVVALIATQMILLALRSRDLTGSGQSIEVPMFENIASFVLQEHIGQKTFSPYRGEMGDRRVMNAKARPIKTKDGYICVSANTDKQVRGFFNATGQVELLDDPKFSTVEARLRNVDEFFELRNQSLGDKNTDQWLVLFEQFDVPAFAYNSLEDLLHEPHLIEAGLFEEVEYPAEGRIKHLGLANTFSGGSRQSKMPAPLLGQNTVEVLSGLGYSTADIENLVADNVIFKAD